MFENILTKEFILSKRTVGIAVGAILRFLSSKGYIVPEGTQEEIVNAVIEIGTAVWVLGTKAWDMHKAKKAAKA